MAKIRILAIEDNAIHAAKLEMLLDDMGYVLIHIAKDEEEAMRLFNATQPDLVLMDIELANNSDGIKVAERINTINEVPIIFTTSFTDEKTFNRARSTNPYAYLIKPLEKEDLQRSIELAVYRFAKEHFAGQIEQGYFAGWSQNLMVKESFFIKTSEVLEKVYYSDVLWVSIASDRYCEIITTSRSFRIRASLKQLEGKLAPYQFVRVHRNYIVNLPKVEHINEHEMTLKVGEEFVPMGISYKPLILKQLNIL